MEIHFIMKHVWTSKVFHSLKWQSNLACIMMYNNSLFYRIFSMFFHCLLRLLTPGCCMGVKHFHGVERRLRVSSPTEPLASWIDWLAPTLSLKSAGVFVFHWTESLQHLCPLWHVRVWRMWCGLSQPDAQPHKPNSGRCSGMILDQFPTLEHCQLR